MYNNDMKKHPAISLKDIPKFSKGLAKNLKGGEIFALVGPLGAGKTAFVKAVAKALKLKANITSPTFTLLHGFPIALKGRELMLYHLDLYRIKNFREAKALGLAEFWGQPHTITFIEWADKIKGHLPKKTQTITFVHL